MRREEELSCLDKLDAREKCGGQTHATTKMNVTIVVTIIIVNSNKRSSIQLDAYFKS